MQEGELEHSVELGIARDIDYVRDKLLEKGDFEAAQKECKKMVTTMAVFPQMCEYVGFLNGLRELGDQKASEKNVRFLFGILYDFYNKISTTCMPRPAQGENRGS